MVLIINEWDDLKAFIQGNPSGRIFYKADYLDDERTRLRMMAGPLGLDVTYTEKDAELVRGILGFLDEHGALPIVLQKDDAEFFK
jgi:hypothetical protein